MSTAAERAISMPEVVELILLELPLQDLLINAQRVNRLFHDLIVSSQSLQQALFFHPIQGNPQSQARTNPLLQAKFPPWFEDKWLSSRMYRISDGKQLRKLDWNSSKEKIEAYSRKEASWRRMLLIQPPVKDLIVKKYGDEGGGMSQSRGKVEFGNGLRMGLFYDLVQGFMENHVGSYFVVRWFLPPEYGEKDGNLRGPDDDDVSHNSLVRLYLRSTRGRVHSRIGPEFKSLASEQIAIDYYPETQPEDLLFIH